MASTGVSGGFAVGLRTPDRRAENSVPKSGEQPPLPAGACTSCRPRGPGRTRTRTRAAAMT
ncbi:hypothetical protein NKH77_44825 [Streptomyces sp. M19]